MADEYQTAFDQVKVVAPPALPPSVQLLQLAYGFAASQAVYVAAKIGLADQLSAGPRSSAEVAAALGADAERTHRLMRGLAHYGVLAQAADGRFRLTPVGEYLQSYVPGSLRVGTIFFVEEHYPAWGGLLHAFQTGAIAFDHIFGKSFYAYLHSEVDRQEGLHSFMVDQAKGTAKSLLEYYDFAAAQQIVDVGGGYGTILADILLAHPQLHGVFFDIVTEGLDLFFEASGLRDRCQVVQGDFFQAVPAGGDVYLLTAILHNWVDADAVKILKNIRQAMAPGGKVVVVELLVPERVTGPSPAVEMDLMMWVLLNGYERTEAQFHSIFDAAGFRLSRIIPTRGPRPIIEAVARADA
ncbi:MAG TPA: methyltransferase [Chloroflexia bacterium]|nr:methyltransferase [Chloroflexia bacterium]